MATLALQDTLFRGEASLQPPADFHPRLWQSVCESRFRDKLDVWDSLSPLIYQTVACPAAGKTKMVASCTQSSLRSGRAVRVVYVAPTWSVAMAAQETFKKFGINLDIWNTKKTPSLYSHGFVTLYQSMIKPGVAELHAQLCGQYPTFVILDENHHLAKLLTWGKAVLAAFSRAAVIFNMSGTPDRTDRLELPFAKYIPCGKKCKLRADFEYGIGEAVADKVCRLPIFRFWDADVDVPGIGSRTFDEKFSDEMNAKLLLAATRPGSQGRRKMLEAAINECREQNRRMIVFAGGSNHKDTAGVADIMQWLPQELKSLGVRVDGSNQEYVPIVGTDRKAAKKICEFRDNPSRLILGSVNMVSEGVDIPDISCNVSLSTVKSKMMNTQRIGRALRGLEYHEDAILFYFKHPWAVELAREIHSGIVAERELREHLQDRKKGEKSTRGEPDADFLCTDATETLLVGGEIECTTEEYREHAEIIAHETHQPVTPAAVFAAVHMTRRARRAANRK